VYQGELFRQRPQANAIFSDLAGQFDDKCLALEPLNVRQRLAQEIEPQLIAYFGSVSHRILFNEKIGFSRRRKGRTEDANKSRFVLLCAFCFPLRLCEKLTRTFA
jgi:hypothetical protein